MGDSSLFLFMSIGLAFLAILTALLLGAAVTAVTCRTP